MRVYALKDHEGQQILLLLHCSLPKRLKDKWTFQVHKSSTAAAWVRHNSSNIIMRFPQKKTDWNVENQVNLCTCGLDILWCLRSTFQMLKTSNQGMTFNALRDTFHFSTTYINVSLSMYKRYRNGTPSLNWSPKSNAFFSPITTVKAWKIFARGTFFTFTTPISFFSSTLTFEMLP